MSSLPPTTPRIEDLKARLRLDPKSRHFYPLAEELRKMGQLEEAEKILREGLTHHGSYLSAWVSLGRILAEKGEHREAIDALLKALALDPGNVVCARLLSTSYLALGDKVEALKKLKLVRAVMPGDDELDEEIARLDAEVESGASRPAGFAPPAPEEALVPAAPETEAPPQGAAAASGAAGEPEPAEARAEVSEAPPAPSSTEPERPTVETADAVAAGTAAMEREDAAPPESAESPAAGWETPPASPFLTEPEDEALLAGEPSPAEAADLLPEEAFAPPFEADRPAGTSLPEAPRGAFAFPEPAGFGEEAAQERIEEALPEETSPLISGEATAAPGGAAEPFSLEEESAAVPADERWPSEREESPVEPAAIADDRTATLTMADLYAKQGHDTAAREIYERVLERDPANDDVRVRLASLSAASPTPQPDRSREAAERLERWLRKVGRREL